jgi:ABC-type phosphate/phosphonate transport system permease subunit
MICLTTVDCIVWAARFYERFIDMCVRRLHARIRTFDEMYMLIEVLTQARGSATQARGSATSWRCPEC